MFAFTSTVGRRVPISEGRKTRWCAVVCTLKRQDHFSHSVSDLSKWYTLTTKSIFIQHIYTYLKIVLESESSLCLWCDITSGAWNMCKKWLADVLLLLLPWEVYSDPCGPSDKSKTYEPGSVTLWHAGNARQPLPCHNVDLSVDMESLSVNVAARWNMIPY